jgi:hypothetical protein
MLTCNLIGGLGNQLFQIFTTISLSLNSSNRFFFKNVELLDGGKRHTYWGTFFFKLKPFLKPVYCNFVVIKELSFAYNKIYSHTLMGKDICLYGYYQSYKYFEDNFKTICNMLKIEDQKGSIINTLDYPILFLENSISIHFRLGDYKSLTNVYHLLTFNYYENAINTIIGVNSYDSFNIIFFCEDEDIIEVSLIVDALKKQFSKCYFIRVPKHLKDWEQLLLMSCCKHNIIANSSFSWWGAYLNTHSDKIVCYPSDWFQDAVGHSTEDLFPCEWTKVSAK